MHSTSILWLLKELRGCNLQNFVPSTCAYAFGRSPNFLKQELQLRPNVKNTASVILWVRQISQQMARNCICWIVIAAKYQPVAYLF